MLQLGLTKSIKNTFLRAKNDRVKLVIQKLLLLRNKLRLIPQSIEIGF
jgi:hypothetical protein